jgi:glycosyltransferase involved in cell wall biosynthesis
VAPNALSSAVDGVSAVKVSIVTSTYDRAATLPRLYDSLCRQTFKDFEWVIVDDGSTDGSRALVEGWQREAPFPILYNWQENAGVGTGRNRAIERARGEFCALIDSDDWYLPEALERMVAAWEGIPPERREAFANVEGLRVDTDGELVLDRFPADVFDSDHFELRALHGVHGDTIGMFHSSVLKAFPFPEDLGWHASPGITWNRIASEYRTRFVNEIWAGTDYQPDGLTSRQTQLRTRFPRARLVYWREYAAMTKPMRLRNRIRANANYVRYSMLCHVGWKPLLGRAPNRAWALMGLLPGLLLYLRDGLL